MPKVSIIIPAYNAENTITESINAVLQQTFKDFELIIVNDGSTDNTEKIISSFTDNRIKYFTQKNKGQCAANNFGLAQAKGDYIKFFDADDVMNATHIEAQYEKVKNSKTNIASCKWGRFYDDDFTNTKFIPESVWKDFATLDWIKAALTQRHDMMGGCLWLIPRQILEKVSGWDESLSLNNDFEFSVRLLLGAENVIFTENALLYYRTGNNNSLSNATNASKYNAAYKANLLGCNHLLAVDNSKFVQKLCANRFQDWVYAIYPNHLDIVQKFEMQIKAWGGSNISIEGGKALIFLSKLLGWKNAIRIKLFLNKYIRS